MVMFFFTITRNVTRWACFPDKLSTCAKVYQTFVLYFVTYFLNFFCLCLILAFTVFVLANWRPEFEDPEHPDYCNRDVYRLSFGVIIIAWIVILANVSKRTVRMAGKQRRKRNTRIL